MHNLFAVCISVFPAITSSIWHPHPANIFGSAVRDYLCYRICLFCYTYLDPPLIKGLTHYGMGLGFLGFCIFIPGYLISYFMPDAKFEIGLALLIIFISVAIASLIQGTKYR